MTDPARIDAVRVQLAALGAELDKLTADATAAPTSAPGAVIDNAHDPDKTYEKPKQQTSEDAIAWIRKKYGKTRSEVIAERSASTPAELPAIPADSGGTTSADGRAEAQRRSARR